ncbi:MAG: phospholipase D-like domain-containing protein, partial [Spirulinaceae cyanobacterium]
RSPQILQVGNATVTLNFSPLSPSEPWQHSTNGLIGRTLQQAQSQVDLALFVFSEQPIADILRDRHQNGVTVRALIDPSFAFRNFSEGLDMLGATLLQDCKVEDNNAPWPQPIETVGMAALPSGDKLHHKVAVIDQRIVITGSHNWSIAANHDNDETLLVIDNPTVAAHFQREFERLYQNASLGLPPRIQDKIAQAATQCQ